MITILMPTMNRTDFVRRALHYYYRVGFKGCISIGDSSRQGQAERIRQLCGELDGSLNLVYRHFPAQEFLHDGMCMKEMIARVETPFAVYSGDDDFLVPEGLARCAEFLQANQGYSAAHGLRINFRLDRPGPWGLLSHAHLLGGQNLEADTAPERWSNYMRTGFSTQYYVHRTDTWRAMYQDVDQVPSRYLGPELLPCSLTAILGKVKSLDCLTVVFQKNPEQVFSWEQTSIFDLMNHGRWAPSMQTVFRSIQEALIASGEIGRAEARELLTRELWGHLANISVGHFNQRYKQENQPPADPPSQLKELLNPKGTFYTAFRRVCLSVASRLG